MTEKVTATAPGKIILFGEHAVVYGYPALAVPVTQVQAICSITPASSGAGITLIAPDVDRRFNFNTADPGDPLVLAVTHALQGVPSSAPADCEITITSTIPIAAGLGSGAAVSTAIIRAMGIWLNRPFSDQTVSDLVFQVEKVYHGTPSGIDNTVIAFARPICFQKEKPIMSLTVGAPLTLVIGNTGVTSPTWKVVGDLRRRYEADPLRYRAYFEQIAALTTEARQAVEQGQPARVGELMNQNHALLQTLGVSHPSLDSLVQAARQAGALGSKPAGAGWGGNMIALVAPEQSPTVAAALQNAGAVGVIVTTLE